MSTVDGITYCDRCGIYLGPTQTVTVVNDLELCSRCADHKPCPDCAAMRQQLTDAQAQNAKLRDALTRMLAAYDAVAATLGTGWVPITIAEARATQQETQP